MQNTPKQLENGGTTNSDFEKLPENHNVFDLYRQFSETA